MLKKHSTKELILSAVTDLLKEKEIEKITVREIVDSCGITAPSFYNHFKDKNEVVSSIYLGWVKPYVSAPLEEWHEFKANLFVSESTFFRHTIYYEGQNNLLNTISELEYRKYLLHIKEEVFQNPVLKNCVCEGILYMIYGSIGLLKESYKGKILITKKEYDGNYKNSWELMGQFTPKVVIENLTETSLREPDSHFFDDLL